jgi:hypothetical protein
MPNQQYSTKNFKIFTKAYKSNQYAQKITNICKQRQQCLPYPQTKMAHCPQCAQKYNTRGMAQVRQNIRERSPKLGWQTLYQKNKTKTNKQNQKTRRIMRGASHKR